MISALRFSGEYGPPNPKFGGRHRPVSAQVRPEIQGTQHPDLYRESQVVNRKIGLFVVSVLSRTCAHLCSMTVVVIPNLLFYQSPHHPESYQRGGSESGGVFDMLVRS